MELSSVHQADEPELLERFLRAQLAGNRREALSVVETSLRGGVPAAVLQSVLRAAQAEVGRLWQEDRISIAQEHVATAIAQLALSHVYQHAPVPTANGKKVLIACIQGEQHDFPARLVADALDLSGFDVRFMGANVPTDSLLESLERERPDLLVLSVTMTFHVPALREALAGVRRLRPELPIAVGGGACSWSRSLGAELAADIFGCDADALVRKARALLEVSP